MFSAKGLAIKRSNGEVVTPFYFAYEDLREDWSKLVEQADAMDVAEEGVKGKMTKKLAIKPKVNEYFLLLLAQHRLLKHHFLHVLLSLLSPSFFDQLVSKSYTDRTAHRTTVFVY